MNKHYDVLIIGTGAAGLYSALCLSPKLSVLAVSKKDVLLSNSDLAQGGIAAVTTDEDTFESHIEDTMIAGGYANDPEAVKKLIIEGSEDVFNLIKLGVDFDKNKDGSFNMTLEGGHSVCRILHFRS